MKGHLHGFSRILVAGASQVSHFSLSPFPSLYQVDERDQVSVVVIFLRPRPILTPYPAPLPPTPYSVKANDLVGRKLMFDLATVRGIDMAGCSD